MVAYAVGSIATLYRTYAHGYHSPQQILLGTALGCLSHVGLDTFHFSDLVLKTRGVSRERMEMILLGTKTIASLVLYFCLWPVATAGPAITAGQYLFHLLLWAIVVGSSQFCQISAALQNARSA